MQPLLTQPFGLPGIEVEDFYELDDQLIVYASSVTLPDTPTTLST